MHIRRRSTHYIFSALFVVAMGACGDFGGCGACGAAQPLPGGALPPDQTVEGGAQIRVTPGGFQKITALLPGLINDSIGGGFCIGGGDVSLAGLPLAEYCFQNQGQCSPGCRIVPTLNAGGTSVSVTNGNELNVRVSMDVDVNIPIDTIITSACTVRVTTLTTNDIVVDVNLALGIRPDNGELQINVAGINNIDLGGIRFISNGGTACDIAAGAGNFLTIILDFLASNLANLLTPIINEIVQGILPSPLGIAGLMDVGGLLEGVSPGTTASMEARIVPGGYVRMRNNGLSLGVITGLNADEDISTRTGALASEPSLCVPPIPPPNFAIAPANLPMTTRNTFALGVAQEFDGTPEPAGADLAMGISETTLDLAGHHAVTSGMMCLGIGTSFIEQLNVGTIGILVPSVAELQTANGNDPLLLVTRPQRALDFTIGTNTNGEPALTIGISHLEVDFYAFLYERYTRAFTIDLTMNVGVGLEFEQTPTGTVLKPTLNGISADQVTVTVLNSQFVREEAADLEAVLPSIFDLVTPLLGDLPPIDVPSFAGFSLENLSIKKVVTAQDDFLALNATLGASAFMRQQAQTNQLTALAVADMDAKILPLQPPSTGTSRLVGVHTPSPDRVRAALANKGGSLPRVTFQVDRLDANGRELEWAYNLNGGMFRSYTSGSGDLVVSDRAFAWQGKYKVGLKSRVKGDYRTTSKVTYADVIVDSVEPRLVSAEWNGDVYELTIFDIVSANDLHYALGTPDALQPGTPWSEGGYVHLTREQMTPFLIDGVLTVFAKDEAGNIGKIQIAPFHGQPGEGGCECNGSGPTPGGIVVMLFVALMLIGRRNVKRAMRLVMRGRVVASLAVWVGLSVTLSLVPGCDCGNNAGKACETEADCGPDFCGPGDIAFCIDGLCFCEDDIPMGRLGPYSDVAVGSDGAIWVSAYHETYGDLVVAQVDDQVGRIPDKSWEWVDGVPDGPVVIPQSTVRGGISAKGNDVGMYTSIQVGPDGTPMVSYFDRETASLKFAARVGGVWQSHTIEAGTGTLGETGALIGMYTSMSIRTDDGRPGIAYLAHVADTLGGLRAEVRFAAAQSAVPTSAADWMLFKVDSAPIISDPESPNIYPLPEGLGLFVDLTRAPNQAPVVVYYDRANGELKVSKFDPNLGQFATPVVLDGAGSADAGWSPSVQVDAQGVVHVAYVDASNDDLVYITDAQNAVREIVDDGRRIVGTTVDGLPKPEFHFVGEDASLSLANAGVTPLITYQDATTQELLMVVRGATGWERVSIAGATDPYPGGYGFFASGTLFGGDAIVSTWVIDQPNDDNWVEVFRRQIAIE